MLCKSLCSAAVADTGASSSTAGASPLLSYFQSEGASLSVAHQSVRGFLHSKNIRVGESPFTAEERASRLLEKSQGKQEKSKVRILLSTGENDMECRISLDKVEIGKKCIAPCGCTGSQQWIQFSEFNRLRRKEPSQWVTCQTCQQNFDYSAIAVNSGSISANMVSVLLDNPNYLRTSAATFSFVMGYILSVDKLALRFLTSKLFWQAYPHWSKIVHLPLVLKMWGGRVALEYISKFYLKIEGSGMEKLAEIETQMIEESLPVENPIEVLVYEYATGEGEWDEQEDEYEHSGEDEEEEEESEGEEEEEEKLDESTLDLDEFEDEGSCDEDEEEDSYGGDDEEESDAD